MDVDFNIFEEKEKFLRFVENSRLQYIQLKFGNKDNLISFIESEFNIKISKNASYDKIDKILRENSKDFYRDVLRVESHIESAQLYSFYKVLTDIFWETTWTKTFSPIYNFLFGERIKIRKKLELREYAAKIITHFNQGDLAKKWIELTSSGEYPYRPVIHYKHLTIGPFGFLFSLYYREKEIFGRHEPLLAILVDTSPAGEDIIDWKSTDALNVFSTILNELNKKIEEDTSSYPVYNDYLTSIGFEFSYAEWKKELPNELPAFVKLFKYQIKENTIPLMFYQIVQLTAMFFKDVEIIHLFNLLIAKGKLVINPEVIEIEDFKITKEGIIKRPKSWLARPAFELASDIISMRPKSSEEDFRILLTDLLKSGTILYLEQMFDKNFETFKAICTKRGLHKFALIDRHIIPKETAITLILESYGLKTPSTLSLDIRKEIEEFLEDLEDFKTKYKNLAESSLAEKISTLSHKGRTYLERLLKEWLFVMGTLIVHYEDYVSRDKVFVLDRPVFYVSPYSREQELNTIKDRYKEFLGELEVSEDLKRKIDKYTSEGRTNFALGDWYSLVRSAIKYIEQENNLGNTFWKSLPEHFHENVDKRISELEGYFIKENALKWLNIASHEKAMVELRRSVGSRQKALKALLKLDKIISSTLQSLPELITITEKVTEAKTGLEYHKAEYMSNKTNTLKIYGTRLIELSFIYHLITHFEGNSNIVTYPILITDLTDTIF